MKKHYPEPVTDDCHDANGVEYHQEIQRMIDEGEWRGQGQPWNLPSSIRVHEFDGPGSDTADVFRPKKEPERR